MPEKTFSHGVAHMKFSAHINEKVKRTNRSAWLIRTSFTMWTGKCCYLGSVAISSEICNDSVIAGKSYDEEYIMWTVGLSGGGGMFTISQNQRTQITSLKIIKRGV